MKFSLKYTVLFILIFFIAMALRLPKLTQRPMHTDEAVHAIKFKALYEDGFYRYDFHEYHGPTLNYFSLIPAWLELSPAFTEIDEATLRLVPIIFGLGLIGLLLLVIDGLGWPAILFAALFTAISPAMTFYSRYYIQEILLVCFTFAMIAAGYRYFQRKILLWVILAGLFFGLMHATKETCIIAFGSIAPALLFPFILRKQQNSSGFDLSKIIFLQHGLILLGTAALISTLFFSSFFTNIAGIPDSIRTYTTYFHRAGENPVHNHPWFYYLQLLTFFHEPGGPVWSEIMILLLAGTGVSAIFSKRRLPGLDYSFLRFLAIYTGFMLIIYSAIPYKTPWCLLGFLHGLILLAGVGAAIIIRFPVRKWQRFIWALLITFGGIFMTWQSYQANFKYEADPVNPYVYGHTSPDLLKLTAKLEQIAQTTTAGRELYIEVICAGADYWPLPWYLRSFPNVGWWQQVDLNSPAAPLIICSPEFENELMIKLYEIPPPGYKNLYLPLFESDIQLRPGVALSVYIVKELWDEFLERRENNAKGNDQPETDH